MKIKSAEEYIQEVRDNSQVDFMRASDRQMMVDAFNSYAAQFIELAAEQADELGSSYGDSYATRESILKLKQQLK